MSPSSALAIFLYVTALGWVVWRGRSTAQADGMFNVFGRRAKTVQAASGYLSLIGAGELITITQLGFDNGIYLLLFPGGIASGFLFLAFFGGRIRDQASQCGATTMAAYVASAYGRTAGAALTVAYTISLGALLIVQFVTGADLLSSASGISPTAAILILASVILLYLEIGGLVAVLSTDLLRLIFMSVTLIAITMVLSALVPTSHLGAASFSALPMTDAAMLFVLGFFGAVCAGDVWQTIIASDSARVVRRSMLLASIAFLLLGLMIGFLGIAAKTLAGTAHAESTALILAMRTVIPAALVPLVSMLIAGAIMATADTEIWVVSTTLVTTIGAADAEREPTAQMRQTRRKTQAVLPIITAAAVVVSLLAPSAQLVYNALLGLLTALAPAMVAVIFGTRSRMAVSASLWSALAAFAAINIYWELQPPAIALLIPVLTGSAVLAFSALATLTEART